MALIQCPECGARISDTAIECPHCGFRAIVGNGIVPISSLPPLARQTAISIPDIPAVDDGIELVSLTARRRLAKLVSDAKQLEQLAPAIYHSIQELMAERGTIWAADFSQAAEKMMANGELVLSIEKETGQYLPQLRRVDNGQIFEKARLHAEQLPNDLASSLTTLQMQMSLAEIMGEIKDVAANVEALRLETQGDRIGRAKGVWSKLQQAVQIQDATLRAQQLLSIASDATEQRSILQENFDVALKLASSRQSKARERGLAAKNAIIDLTAIALMMRSEYAAYTILEEPTAAKSALDQFESFISKNRLAQKDTLLELNSISSDNLETTIGSFYKIASSMTNLVIGEGKQVNLPELPEKEDRDE